MLINSITALNNINNQKNQLNNIHQNSNSSSKQLYSSNENSGLTLMLFFRPSFFLN